MRAPSRSRRRHEARAGLELALEHYNLLHRLWREDVVDWEGGFRTPLQGFAGYALEDLIHGTPMSVGSPQEVIAKTLTFQEGFDDYQRQLWVVHAMGLPVEMALEQVELLGTEVVPALRMEMGARTAPGVPDAPTHASLVRAKYGDAEPRQPRPNPDRGDNLTGPSPYQDSDPETAAGVALVR